MKFVKIDRSNYMECILLKVAESQKYFVADNAQSLLEAIYEEGLYPLGISVEGKLIGFILYDYDDTLPGWSMSRFMIDEAYQGRGYGKEAVLKFLTYLKEQHQASKVYLSVSIDNKLAYQMYKKIGFKDVKPIEYTFNNHLYQEIQMVKEL